MKEVKIDVVVIGSMQTFDLTKSTTHNFDIHRPRNPKQSDYYKCVENHFEQLQGAWDECYAKE